MILAMMRVMSLSLIRDRGALAMAFLLPPMIFIIFAAIFSGTSGDELRLQVALGIDQPSPSAERLQTALRAEPSLRLLDGTSSTEAKVAALVQSGGADVGLFVSGDLARTDLTPITVLVDPSKAMAGAILAGQVQRIVGVALPDIALARAVPAIASMAGGLSAIQSGQLAAAIEQMSSTSPANEQQLALLDIQTVGSSAQNSATVTYYAGAVAILFLLFSAMQSAATLIEERTSGIVDRVAVGPAGTDAVVLGKFLFLSIQGILQVALIFAVAIIVYRVPVLPHLPAWLLTTVIAAAAAAGLGLAVAAFCTSKQQAQTISTFVVLVCSAIGGSMVPRFMMPPWLQGVGWYTPNAWAIEAYHGALWRGEGLGDIVPELACLLLTALIGVALALWVSRLRLRM